MEMRAEMAEKGSPARGRRSFRSNRTIYDFHSTSIHRLTNTAMIDFACNVSVRLFHMK